MSWCAVLAVLGLSVWLNLDWSRDAYVEPLDNAWRGGLRQGFPLCWWDAGLETEATAVGDQLALNRREYGGWQWSGLAADLLLLAVAAMGAAFVTERVMRARARRQPREQSAAEVPAAIAIRPITVVVAAVVLVSSVSYNLITFTMTARDGTKEYAQVMGWPFTTYSASSPVLKGLARAGGRPLTQAQVVAYLDSHQRVRWRLAHWHTEGIVLNSVTIMILVIGSAFACEAYLRRRRQL
ncbi:MAG: hypothetical protein NTW87_33875 [Planctomycetota bacterium]|nr:hypothetical protein [Planctomycetota bacterium]